MPSTLGAADVFGVYKGYYPATALGSLTPELAPSGTTAALITGLTANRISWAITGDYAASLTGLTHLKVDGVDYAVTSGPTFNGSETETEFGPYGGFTAGNNYTLELVGLGGGGGPYTITADAGSFTFTGQAATLKVGRKIAANTGSLTFAGQAANFSKGFALTAAAGSFAFTGQASGLIVARKIAADAASFTPSGSAAMLLLGRTMTSVAGTFSLSGGAAGLLVGRKVEASGGSFTLAGGSAAILLGRKFAADSGSFTLAGDDATLTKFSPGGATITAETGVFALAGSDAAFLRGIVLQAEGGALVLTGSDATLFKQSTSYTIVIVSPKRGSRMSERPVSPVRKGVGWEAVLSAGLTDDINGYTCMARIYRLPGGRTSYTPDDEVSATAAVTTFAGDETRGPGWHISLASDQTDALDPGVYLARVLISLAGNAVASTDWLLEVQA